MIRLEKHILLGLVGNKGVGKDTFGDLLQDTIRETDRLHTANLKFASPIKELIAELTGGDVATIEANKNRPELRFILQRLGTEFGRAQSANYWIDKLAGQVEGMKQPCVVIISDTRFLNEAAYIKSKGGLLIRVRRNIQSEMALVEQHQSETELNKIEHDFWVDNNSSLGRLRAEAEQNWSYIKERLHLS